MTPSIQERTERLTDADDRLLRQPGDAPLDLSRPRLGVPGEDEAVILDPATGKPRWWRDRLRRRYLLLADAALVAGLALVTCVLTDASLLWLCAVVPAGLITAKLLGLYDADHQAIRHLTVDEFPGLVALCGAAVTIAVMVVPGYLSGKAFMALFLCSIGASIMLRVAARWYWRRQTPPERTLVVGEGEPAEALGRKIELFDDMHLELKRIESPHDHLEPVGGEDHVAMDAALLDIDRVVIAWADASPRLIERLLDHCRRREVKLSVVSPFRGRARPATVLSLVADLPVLEYNTWDVPRSTMILKRALDFTIAVAALILLAPLMMAVAAAIKVHDRGPIFFTQLRAGLDGKPFKMIKFRSMAINAESRLGDLVNLDHLADPMFKLKGDPRVTPVGRFLRRFSLDELPQLINVARGEMSAVGPRPEELRVVERYRPEHLFRLNLKPGLTGPMQVFGRGELTFPERLAVEQDYLENMSVLRDIHFLAQTLPAVVKGRGAF